MGPKGTRGRCHDHAGEDACIHLPGMCSLQASALGQHGQYWDRDTTLAGKDESMSQQIYVVWLGAFESGDVVQSQVTLQDPGRDTVSACQSEAHQTDSLA